MNLHYNIVCCHGVVVHIGIEKRKAARGEGSILPVSKVSPIPTLNVPEITVTFSRNGCQCGAIRYPAGNFSRTV